MLLLIIAACPLATFRRKSPIMRKGSRRLELIEFPAVWQPPEENEEQRQLLLDRCRLVEMRTQTRNQLDSLAKNEGLLRKGMWRPARRDELEALPLVGWRGQWRTDLIAVLEDLNRRIAPLDEAVGAAAEQNAEARLLVAHPGVGPIVALAYVLVIGDWRRFERGKKVASYLGLIPAEESTGGKQRLGQISKQGSPLLRWLLVEAAAIAQRCDASWHRQYVRLSMTKHHGWPRWP